MIRKQSYLRSKPDWLEYVPNANKPEVDDFFGFDENGMWFYGNSSDEESSIAYPIRTNFDYATSDVCEVTFTFKHGDTVGEGGEGPDNCSDQGICFFNTGTDPEWNWGNNETRIAYSINCPRPFIYGLADEVEASIDFIIGNYYTAHVTYDPSFGVTAKLYAGNKVIGTPISTLILNEVLPEGTYRIGFDADKDSGDGLEYSYFTNLILGPIEEQAITSCVSCTTIVPGFNCLAPAATSNTCSCRSWKQFYANCPKGNRQCSKESRAYLPAITVCTQRLF